MFVIPKEKYKLFPVEYKKLVVKAIADAFRKNANDFAIEFDLDTTNGVDFLKWDFINTNLIRTVSDERIRSIKVKRGRWELVMFFDKQTNYLYSLMRHKRFNQLSNQRRKRSKAHYIDALTSFNKGLRPRSGVEVLTLFADTVWDEQVHNLILSLVGEYEEKIEGFVLIGFSSGKDDITEISAILPTADLDIAYEEDWSEYIPAEFNPNIATFDYTSLTSEEDEIEVNLKPEFQAEDNDDIDLPLKNDDNEKKDEEG